MSLSHVTIGIVTHQRPESLRRLLESLAELRMVQVKPPKVRICIVDNDADGSARPAFNSHPLPPSYEVVYEIVPERGLSFVRNRAIELALDTDCLAFIDDDQVADPRWLDELLAAQMRYDADVVWGRNQAKFDSPPSATVQRLGYFSRNGIRGGDRSVRHNRRLKMGYFDPPAVESGGSCTHADTNNVLICAAVLKSELRFDRRFNSCGGEDREFFGRVAQAGHRIVWANEAQTYECISPERMNLSWMMRREYAAGISYARTLLAQGNGWPARGERAIKACGHLTVGSALCLGGVLLGAHVRGRGCLWIARGAGTITGLLGGDCAVYS